MKLTRNIYSGQHVIGLSLLLTVLVFSCSTARNRDAPQTLTATAAFLEQDTARFLKDALKSGDIYADYEPLMHIDVLQRNDAYIRHLGNELGENLFWTDPETAAFISKETAAAAKYMSFIVSLHHPKNKEIDLGKSHIWSLRVMDETQNTYIPVTITRLENESPDIIFIKKYLRTFDRFSEYYQVDFPVITIHSVLKNTPSADAPATVDEAEEPPFWLVLGGIKGWTRMQFP